MDFDTQADSILKELTFITSVATHKLHIGEINEDEVNERVRGELERALAAIKQLIESKQPETREPTGHDRRNQYEKDFDDGWERACDAWRERMGLS